MTDRKQALTDLLEKVEAGRDLEDMFEVPASVGTEGQSEHFIEAYNGSLNAAKALHEAVLPEWGMETFNLSGEIVLKREKPVDTAYGEALRDGNPARVWLIAILKALIAKECEQ